MQIKEFKEKEVDVKDKSLSNKVYFAVGGIVLSSDIDSCSIYKLLMNLT